MKKEWKKEVGEQTQLFKPVRKGKGRNEDLPEELIGFIDSKDVKRNFAKKQKYKQKRFK